MLAEYWEKNDLQSIDIIFISRTKVVWGKAELLLVSIHQTAACNLQLHVLAGVRPQIFPSLGVGTPI